MRYKAKRVKTHVFLKGVGQFEPRFQGEEVVPREYFLVSTKLDTFCYLTVQTAPCYVQLFRHNTGVRQTDRETDGRNCYSQYSACNASIAACCKKAPIVSLFKYDFSCSCATFDNVSTDIARRAVPLQ